MRHELYGRRTTDVAVCVPTLRHELSSLARTLESWVRGIYVYVRLFCVCVILCVGSRLVTG
jgi:hypothetical protein